MSVQFICIAALTIPLFTGCATNCAEFASSSELLSPKSVSAGKWVGPLGIECLVVSDVYCHFLFREPVVDENNYVEYWVIRNYDGGDQEEVFFLNRRGMSLQGIQPLELFIPRNNLSDWSLSIVQYNRSKSPSKEDTGLTVDKTYNYMLSEIVSKIVSWHKTESLFLSEEEFDALDEE